jgi:hypothetical protein
MKIKKLLSIILSACILICACAVPSIVSAEETAHTHEWSSECKTECGGECGVSPVIIVHGIMQSQVYVQDKDGNDLMTSDGFPIVEGMDMAFMFDTVALGNAFKEAIGKILPGNHPNVKNAAKEFLKETGKAVWNEIKTGIADGLFVNYVKRGTQWFSGLYTGAKSTYESFA